jgi:hypothetical protein
MFSEPSELSFLQKIQEEQGDLPRMLDIRCDFSTMSQKEQKKQSVVLRVVDF